MEDALIESKLLAKLAERPLGQWAYNNISDLYTYKIDFCNFTATFSAREFSKYEHHEITKEEYIVRLLVQNKDLDLKPIFDKTASTGSCPLRKRRNKGLPSSNDPPIVKFYRELTEKIELYETEHENKLFLEARQKLEAFLNEK